MDGDFALERQINAYLTRQFIGRRGVPSDECRDEARKVICMVLFDLLRFFDAKGKKG
jgi:hypothetical protein